MDEYEVQKILSKKLLKPSSPTPPHLQFYSLSLFDQLAPPSSIRIFLCYKSSSNFLDKAEIFNQFKNSLSDTLTKFYPLSGRINLQDHGALIDCNDQGIEYTEAEINKGLDEFLDNDGIGEKVEILDQFVPKDFSGADLVGKPLVSIQISLFKCGGISIGFSVSHMIADTSTLVKFINGWAAATTSRLVDSSRMVFSPNFDVPLIFPSTDEIGSVYPSSSPISSTRIGTKKITFKGSLISKLRTQFRNFQPSRVIVVTAVIWKALIKISQEKNGGILRPSWISPAMSLRGKTGIGTSENSFGNLWMPMIARFEPGKLKFDIHDLVATLDDAVRGTAEKIKKASREEIVSMAINGMREVIGEKVNNSNLDVFTCTSWCRFPINEADFGWGKPYKVSSLSRPYEMFTLWDSKFGDSIEALVCLNEKDLAQLNLDEDLLAFTSCAGVTHAQRAPTLQSEREFGGCK